MSLCAPTPAPHLSVDVDLLTAPIGRMDETRYTDPEHGWDLRLPAGWTAEADAEEGGVEVWNPDGVGALHLIGFPQPPDEFPDPAEELYAFLDEQGVELEEDEVQDLELADEAEMAICEYLSEDEDDPEAEPTFWTVGVATAPGMLVFATYSCPAGEEERERESVRRILASLRPHGRG